MHHRCLATKIATSVPQTQGRVDTVNGRLPKVPGGGVREALLSALIWQRPDTPIAGAKLVVEHVRGGSLVPEVWRGARAAWHDK